MKIIYHEKFRDPNYAYNPAAAPGRIECILEKLEGRKDLEWVKPNPVNVETLKLVHTSQHINQIRNQGRTLFEMARLATGGAVKSAILAYRNEPCFALIRPPGHHASPASAWGFCYFNNLAIAIESLRFENKIESAYILDFDLHTGDGNINSLESKTGIRIHNPKAEDREDYLLEVSEKFEEVGEFDIIAVSAGFDEHIEDWGGKLSTDDYREIGKMVKEFSREKCKGRRFAVLEGGYNHEVLGDNVSAFIEGMD